MKPSLISRFGFAVAIVAVLSLLAPGPLSTLSLAKEKAPRSKAVQDAAMLEKLQLFGDVFARVRAEHVVEISDADLIEAALNGALHSLDPHSRYVAPTDFLEDLKSARREYGGLGIEVSQDIGLVKVNYALEDGPAYKAGIRSGDYVTAVEGVSVRDKDLDEAIKGMRGLAGDPVTVTVLNAQNISKDIVVVRQVVRGRAVRHSVIDGLGYIFIETFNNDTLARDVKRALNDIKRQTKGKIPGLIIDMRGNRGGLLTQSVDVSSLFLDGGEVLSARGRTPEDTERYNAAAGQYDKDLPIVILINSGTASAAEIVAGALQDRGRALVMGDAPLAKVPCSRLYR